MIYSVQIRLGDLRLIPLFAPALKAMFAEYYAEMEVKTARMKRQKLKAAARACELTDSTD